MLPIRIKVNNELCKPHIGSEGAAGMDLRFAVKTGEGYTPFMPGQSIMFSTGVSIEIPEGWVGLLLPRSGFGTKYEVRLKNTVGVIDSDYRGEIKVAIRNCGDKEVMIEDFERVCQLLIVPHYKIYENLVYVSELSDTARGDTGFGSSGKQ